jgi:hypothetical protein
MDRDANNNQHDHATDSARDIIHELEEEGIKRPALWKQAVPWLITAAILWYIFKDINFADFMGKLSNARLVLLLPAMFGFVMVFAIGDLLSWGMCYRWFATPDLTFREMLHVRWGTYLFQALYVPLHAVSLFGYMVRHKGSPIMWVMSAGGFAGLSDMLMVNLVMCVAISLNAIYGFAPELEWWWLCVLLPSWPLLYAHFRYWFTDSRYKYLTRFSNHPLTRSAQLAKPPHYLKVYAVRLTVALAGILAHYLSLRAFMIEVPLPVVVVVAPLIIGGVFLPISGGGFGGPQIVALILLPYVDGDEALLAAYSMSFSACFTMGRSIIGAFFLPGYLKDIREKVPRMTTDPVTGETL